jgi:hypothetical protein
MARMVSHPSQVLDELGHPRQGPQIRPEALGARSLAQGPVELLQLLALQLRFAARPPGGAQSLRAALFPLPVPAADTLATDLESSGDRRKPLARAEQLGGSSASIFECLEIASWMHKCFHAPSISEELEIVTVFCEIQ